MYQNLPNSEFPIGYKGCFQIFNTASNTVSNAVVNNLEHISLRSDIFFYP